MEGEDLEMFGVLGMVGSFLVNLPEEFLGGRLDCLGIRWVAKCNQCGVD